MIQHVIAPNYLNRQNVEVPNCIKPLTEAGIFSEKHLTKCDSTKLYYNRGQLFFFAVVGCITRMCNTSHIQIVTNLKIEISKKSPTKSERRLKMAQGYSLASFSIFAAPATALNSPGGHSYCRWGNEQRKT